MRLWHKDIIPYLPKSQLLAQWRELNSIFKKQDNHILINYIYTYDKTELEIYTQLVIREMETRVIKINKWENYFNYFETSYAPNFKCLISVTADCFVNEHNDFYLLVCYYNLAEKFSRGQKDYTLELFKKLQDFMKERGLI